MIFDTKAERDKVMELGKKYEFLKQGYENLCNGFHNYVRVGNKEEHTESWRDCNHPVCKINRMLIQLIEAND